VSQSVPLCTPLQLLRRAAVYARSSAQVSDRFWRDEAIREPGPVATKVYPGRGSDMVMRFSGFRFGNYDSMEKMLIDILEACHGGRCAAAWAGDEQPKGCQKWDMVLIGVWFFSFTASADVHP
jgi:hypothetical protein